MISIKFTKKYLLGTPKDVAIQLKSWLKMHSVSQKRFAENVLMRKQSTLSDVLRVAGNEWPSENRGIWKKILDFLEDKAEQRKLLASAKGKYSICYFQMIQTERLAYNKILQYIMFTISAMGETHPQEHPQH